MRFGKRLLSGFVAALLAASPVLAAPYNPTGIWEASDGESRYDVTLCGDGTQLCARLIWIRPDVTNDRNRVYIDTYVVEGARRHSDREWRGKINLYGHSVAGSVRHLGNDALQVRGCALLILCERQTLSRISTSSASGS